MNETDIMRLCLIGLYRQYPSGLWYRRNTGALKTDSGFVRFGLPGMADIGGILHSIAWEIEIKSAKGKQSDEQKNWQQAVERAGGIYILTRSVENCLEQISLHIKRLTGHAPIPATRPDA